MRDTKNYILGVALKLFLQKSFKEVTMKEIVEKTGLSKGAFYHYFESKEKLFQEIIEQFFAALMSFDFNILSADSFMHFYRDYIRLMNELRFHFFENEQANQEDVLDINFFSLLFDAFKLFPEYRLKMEEYHKKENDAWAKAVKRAKESGEINSSINDEQIAMMFLYSGDGLALNLTMNKSEENLEKELTLLWDGLYESIKT